MADTDQAFVGRCGDCGKLHAVIVVTPQTSREVSRVVREMEDDGLTVEQTTVGKARSELALSDCQVSEAAGA